MEQANVIFPGKSNSNSFSDPPVRFSENNITKCSQQKYLRVVLDSKLNFNTHIDQKITKCNKLIGLMKMLSVNLPQKALLVIYKSFIRPQLEYGDCLYDNQIMKNFKTNYKSYLFDNSLL